MTTRTTTSRPKNVRATKRPPLTETVVPVTASLGRGKTPASPVHRAETSTAWGTRRTTGKRRGPTPTWYGNRHHSPNRHGYAKSARS